MYFWVPSHGGRKLAMVSQDSIKKTQGKIKGNKNWNPLGKTISKSHNLTPGLC
jgi:hypothetical protein